MTERVELPGGAWVDLVDPGEFIASRVRSPGAHRWAYPGDRHGVLGDLGGFLALVITAWSFDALPVPRRGDVRSLDKIPWPAAEALSRVAEDWLDRVLDEAAAQGAVLPGGPRPGTTLIATSTGFKGRAR